LFKTTKTGEDAEVASEAGVIFGTTVEVSEVGLWVKSMAEAGFESMAETDVMFGTIYRQPSVYFYLYLCLYQGYKPCKN
jgi:hypothetical protein